MDRNNDQNDNGDDRPDDDDDAVTTLNSSSIFGSNFLCGMFENSKNSKTDACAIFCCGIFLWQRNKDLLTRYQQQEQDGVHSTFFSSLEGTEQPSSPLSLSSVLLPTAIKRSVEIGFVLLLVITGVVWSIDPQNKFTFILTCAGWVLVICSVWKVFEYQQKRKKFRKQLAIAEYRRRCRCRDKNKNNDKDDGDRSSPSPSSSATDADAELAVFLDQHRREIDGDGAHDIFGCARSNTGLCCHRYRSERSVGRRAVDVDTSDDGNNDDDGEEESQVGFCLGAWRFLANLCCGLLCGCNLQLFGMCAIAQEQRYLKEVLPSSTARPDLWQRDYITMQPWSEYYPAILRLRLSYQSNFFSHLKAMSTLSRRILITAVTFVVFISLMVLLPVRFPRWQILILYGTILQPVVFLAFVHWMWNRFDLSLDAIVKYAACGFFICTSTTILYELAASKIAQRIMILIGIIGSEGLKLYREHITGAVHPRYIEPPIGYELTIAVIGAFIQAFFVASMVEEFCKYLCFSMVEHPDLERKVMLPSSLFRAGKFDEALAEDTTLDDGHDDEETTRLYSRDQITSQPPSNHEIMVAPTAPLVSIGEAITVAMVAGALGFACAENLIYVFVYTPPDLESEISTLYVRCLFPIHPLCAAIQSIGVCRRYLERDPSIKIGRIVFPGWILHGCFDFALMAYSAINKVTMRHKVYHPSGIDGKGDDNDTSTPYLLYVMGIPFLGMLYFLYESWFQRERLDKLDRENRIAA